MYPVGQQKLLFERFEERNNYEVLTWPTDSIKHLWDVLDKQV